MFLVVNMPANGTPFLTTYAVVARANCLGRRRKLFVLADVPGLQPFSRSLIPSCFFPEAMQSASAGAEVLDHPHQGSVTKTRRDAPPKKQLPGGDLSNAPS